MDLRNFKKTFCSVNAPVDMGGDKVCWADKKTLLFSSYFSIFRIDVENFHVSGVPSLTKGYTAVVKHK